MTETYKPWELSIPLHLRTLKVGSIIDITPLPRWYERLWQWFRRAILRRPEPKPIVHRITAIDYDTRTVTYEITRDAE